MPICHVLFIISGLGMGNSTRCHAIIQELHDLGVRISILSSGNGVQYFSNVPEIHSIHEMIPLRYGSQGENISIGNTLKLIPEYRQTLRTNAQNIEDVLDSIRPDVVVLDSTYITAPMRRRKIPIVAINNADFIYRNYFRMGGIPPASTWAQYFCIEMMDHFYHQLSVDIILSPSLVPSGISSRGRVRLIGPLVRRGYKPKVNKMHPTNGLVMLSGSAFGSQIDENFVTCGLQVDVIGREEPTNWPATRDDVVFHGKVMNNHTVLSSNDLAVINCGYSAVSECIHLRMPLVVVPIANHAEQWVNAKIVEKLGLGIIALATELDEKLQLLKDNYQHHIAAYDRLDSMPEDSTGRHQAAAIIIDMARNDEKTNS